MNVLPFLILHFERSTFCLFYLLIVLPFDCSTFIHSAFFHSTFCNYTFCTGADGSKSIPLTFFANIPFKAVLLYLLPESSGILPERLTFLTKFTLRHSFGHWISTFHRSLESLENFLRSNSA